MERLIGAVAMFVAAGPVFAAEVATCTLGADKKTVTVTATNPYSQVMACEVTCHMAVPNGFGSVVCGKPVPVGAKDWVMCTETSDHSYTRVKEVSLHCPDPSAPPPASKADSDSKDDDEDDAKFNEKAQQMIKQGQEMLQQFNKNRK